MRILIADDDPISRKILRLHLTSAGHEVVEAVNGRIAWELLQRDRIPLVISDWMMPEMEGPELVRRIRSAGFERYTYVILLTAQDGRDDIVSGLESGADDYLCKPFHPEEMTARIEIGVRILHLEARLLQAHQEMELLATRDSLTDLLNRRAIRERAVAALRRAHDENVSLAFIMVDVDRFKSVNDLHGHLVGDQALRVIARAIARGIRPQDAAGRWGGEEFLIILKDAGLSIAAQTAERVRERVHQATLPLADGTELQLRVSAGVSCSGQQPSCSLDALLQQADDALYEAKRGGRDRVCIAPPTVQGPEAIGV